MIGKKFPFLEFCATLCNATFQFSRKQKFPFLEICVTSRDNHGIESNPNRIQIESNSIRSNPNRLNLIRDSVESNSNLTQFDSIRFVRNTKHDPRKLINGIQQATLFEQFLALARFSPILPIHNLSGINWDCTWFCLSNDVETPSCHTSFAHNSTFSWVSKLLLDELPLLSKLQLRRPDLYLAEWNCVSCGLAPETCSHFCSCPTILPKLVGLKEATKQAF